MTSILPLYFKIGSEMGQKNAKGTVSILNDANRIRLRWRYQQKRYSLSLFAYTKANLLQAKQIALTIEQDMVSGGFDATLNRYNLVNPKTSSIEQKSLVNHFGEWTADYRNIDINQDKDYFFTKQMLQRWGDFNVHNTLDKLKGEPLCAKTYNSRLRLLKGFFMWMVRSKRIESNPLEDVLPKRINKVVKNERKPFTQEEIKQVLEAFKNDAFCPVCSYFKHSFYHPFVYFIFQTGVRNAEAIGLRVKHIHFNEGYVEIKEAMARTIKGTHAAARIRKETKNGKERRLPLDKELISILQPLVANKGADDLVFLSPKGLPIDDRMFQRRVFRKVLQGLGIENRVLYACRHTFGSRCIQEGLTPVMTAFLMGNNPETALRSYTHQIALPEKLPRLDMGS
jgi:integrase